MGLEDAEGVAGVEDVVGFVAEGFGDEEEGEAGGGGAVVGGVEVNGAAVGAEEVGEGFAAEFRWEVEETEGSFGDGACWLLRQRRVIGWMRHERKWIVCPACREKSSM